LVAAKKTLTQNETVEHPHRHWKFDPCHAFRCVLGISLLAVYDDRVKTPNKRCSTCSDKPVLSHLHNFGCRVYVEPSRPRRPAKTEIDARTAIFIGYAQTLKNLLYFDLEYLTK
jgi:hypothetical protein